MTDEQHSIRKYGYDRTGNKIVAPEGWYIIEEGGEIPQAHREFRDYPPSDWRGWCDPRRCHSTMTPMSARLWGAVYAFAGKEEQ